MSKILYPVGTQVKVKSVLNHSPLFVVDYRKGEKYPYRLGDTPSGQPVEVAGKSKFSIKGLKRSSPTQTQDKKCFDNFIAELAELVGKYTK